MDQLFEQYCPLIKPIAYVTGIVNWKEMMMMMMMIQQQNRKVEFGFTIRWKGYQKENREARTVNIFLCYTIVF